MKTLIIIYSILFVTPIIIILWKLALNNSMNININHNYEDKEK